MTGPPEPENVEPGQVWLTGATAPEHEERTSVVRVEEYPDINSGEVVVTTLESWNDEYEGHESSVGIRTFRARMYHRE